MPELLFEIGTEELPASFIEPALEYMKSFIQNSFKDNRLTHGEVKVLGTPRRLMLLVRDGAEKQENLKIEKLGPLAKIAFDQNNQPTNAALGFAKSANVDVSALKVVTTPKGSYVGVSLEEVGQKTTELLPGLLLRLIETIPFKKSMHWGDQKIKFARPIHWLLAIFGGEVIPLSFGNISSSNYSYGHRFSPREKIVVGSFAEYAQKIRAAGVILDTSERREKIRTEAAALAATVHGKIHPDPTLLDDLAGLTEYPTTTLGSFDRSFLELPRQVLRSTMKGHQKYFSIIDDAGNILPHFVVINNSLAEDQTLIRKGNERVIVARLNDARFFFNKDQKIALADRAEKLKYIMFHAKLGNMHEKVGRLGQLTEKLPSLVDINPLQLTTLRRAASLCKSDLASEMVGEFPELQGIMGSVYARLGGETPEVASTILEHYLPLGAEGELPQTLPGALLGLMDKIDTMAGFFAINQAPKGGGDPFGLRRAALGIIRILIQQRINLPLPTLIAAGLELYREQAKISFDLPATASKIMDFIRERFRMFLSGTLGYPLNAIDAVIETHFADVYDSYNKIESLLKFKEDANFLNLATGFKRVVGILSKMSSFTARVDETLLQAEAEKNLHQAYLAIHSHTEQLLENRQYEAALPEFARLRDPIDRFFEKVTVMDENESLRLNRLRLLKEIKDLFFHFGDISKLATS